MAIYSILDVEPVVRAYHKYILVEEGLGFFHHFNWKIHNLSIQYFRQTLNIF